jgi:hypothetical protein
MLSIHVRNFFLTLIVTGSSQFRTLPNVALNFFLATVATLPHIALDELSASSGSRAEPNAVYDTACIKRNVKRRIHKGTI